MTNTQFFILLGISSLGLILIFSVVWEVFVDVELKSLKRRVKVKTLQAQEQVISMKMESMFQEIEGAPINEDKDSADQPNAVGYGVKRD